MQHPAMQRLLNLPLELCGASPLDDLESVNNPGIGLPCLQCMYVPLQNNKLDARRIIKLTMSTVIVQMNMNDDDK
jgi:hypothetical protein